MRGTLCPFDCYYAKVWQVSLHATPPYCSSLFPKNSVFGTEQIFGKIRYTCSVFVNKINIHKNMDESVKLEALIVLTYVCLLIRKILFSSP